MEDTPTYPRVVGRVLGVPVDRISCESAAELVCTWAAEGRSRVVFAANVHMTMEAVDDPAFRGLMESADLVVADGRPVAWALQRLGFADATHVRGQDLVLAVCRLAAQRGLRIGLFGTTDDVLLAAERALAAQMPSLEVAYVRAPPFGPLDGAEDARVVEACRRCGVDILFVSLGCP
jgi:N-acetylglucosaminyldiphosphoundecaprenol N-acetyl-beta-D-mannosaminyltransferase